MKVLPSYARVNAWIFNILAANLLENQVEKQYLADKVTAALSTQILQKRHEILQEISQKGKYRFSTLEIPGLSVDFSLNTISLSRVKILKSLVLGQAVIVLMLVGLFMPKPKLQLTKRVTLVFGLSDHHIFYRGKTDPIKEFFSQKEFVFDSTTDLYILQSRRFRLSKKLLEDRILVTIDSAFYLYRNYLRFRIKVQLLSRAVSRLYLIMRSPGKHSAEIFCIKEILLDIPLARGPLFPAQIQNLITTPSNLFLKPPMVLAKTGEIPITMIWYSSNSVPINPEGIFNELFENSYYSKHQADRHYVWSNSHAEYLSKITTGEVVVNGSMMFYGPSQERFDQDKFRILIFDVSPSHFPFLQESIYSSKLAIDFIDNIARLNTDLKISHSGKINTILKTKKNNVSAIDATYIDFLRKVDFEIADSKVNLYDLINSANFVICYPFTSPAIIAKEQGIPVCYFSTASNFRLPDERDDIPVHKSLDSLKSHVNSALFTYLEE